jgi:acetoin utilization deacetylase AcuC-like enzyme
MATAFIYDSAYTKHTTGHHPENLRRYEVILSAIESDRDLWEKLLKVAPREASDEDITRCHSRQLIEHIRGLCQSGTRFVDVDTVVCQESFKVALLAAGAAVSAVDKVFEGAATNAFAAVRPPGHHATITNSMGFCLFNNAAVGARYAQSRYGAERVLIIDWDVHHGNGTQDIFYRDPSVYYFSTHQYPYYPGTGSKSERGLDEGEGTTLNIPLGEGTPAQTHRQAFTDALKEIERVFPPDLIIISAGFDSRLGDPLGGLMLTDSDFREMTKEVIAMAERHAGGRVVSLLEGGYNLQTLGETVRTHVEALSS